MTEPTTYYTESAAVNWSDGSGLHIRVYATDGYTITERCGDSDHPSGWTTGTFSQPGAHVSATTWTDQAGAHIRVYCTNAGTITEWCSDPGSSGWTQGSYTSS